MDILLYENGPCARFFMVYGHPPLFEIHILLLGKDFPGLDAYSPDVGRQVPLLATHIPLLDACMLWLGIHFLLFEGCFPVIVASGWSLNVLVSIAFNWLRGLLAGLLWKRVLKQVS